MTLHEYFTEAERAHLALIVTAGLAQARVPEHLRDGLLRYFAQGILPGGFLQAVLCNDLTEAVLRAAPSSLLATRPVIDFLLAHAPAVAWGSRDQVLRWTTTPDRLEV